ncbi:MAG: hypothetical protein JO023_25485 [Chloroflexi bacterium]|nr:hypothetical protein [Chloroflexota bacterium]
MKLINSLLLALLAALGIYAARHRIILALRVGAIAYLLMLPLRLLPVAGEFFDRLDQLVWPIAGLLLVWVVLWWISTTYQRRKEGSGAPPTVRRRKSPS